MRTLEFKARLSDNSLAVPPDVALQIPAGEDVSVIIVVEEAEDPEWVANSGEKLSRAYTEDDSIYDALYANSDLR